MDRALLQSVPLFAGRGGPAMDRMLAASARRRLTPGLALFRRGDPGEAAYVLLRGDLRVCRVDAAGRVFVLRVMAPGELFGELSLLDRRPRSATVAAIRAAEVLAIPRGAFLAWLREEPEAAAALLAELAGRVRGLSDALEGAVSLALRARLARALLELVERFGVATGGGVRVGLPLSQRAIGELLGVSRESVNKQLAGWIRDGVLVRERGWLTVRDLAALRAEAQLDAA